MNQDRVSFEIVSIVGPGLIGASIGLALKRGGMARHVVGIGRRQESLDKAMGIGAVDATTLDPVEGCAEADLVILATPISALEGISRALADGLKSEAIVTDVASSKTRVIEIVCSSLRGRPDVSYIPTHPMAGGEQTGPLAATPDLFRGAVCIFTPLTNTLPESKGQLTRMWHAMGASTVSMSPQMHDRIVAGISHVPHLAASALVSFLSEEQTALCGRGLLDTTRIASGSPGMWMDICRSNSGEIRRSLLDYIAALQDMADALSAGDMSRLRRVLEKAKEKRDRLVARRNTEGRSA
jgi:prephenate dehydrogenase